MKKILLFLAVSFFALSINAQNVFQNPGFENWTETTPNNWNTLSIPVFGNLCDITSSTEFHSGNYAVSIGAQSASGMIIPGFLTNSTIDMTSLMTIFANGINISDFSDPSDFSQLLNFFTDGVQLTQKPTSVNGYYSWNPIDNENEMFILYSIVISNVSGQREVIGGSVYPFTIPASSKATYNSFESPITYVDEESTPTELIFFAITTSLDTTATTFGHLLLDDLSISSTSGLSEISVKKDNSFIIYPNPSKGEFKLNVKSQVEVSVYNQLGQVVVHPVIYTPNKSIKIGEKGIYFVRVKDNSGYKTQKLIVK